MKYLIFRPYWTVPMSIVKKELAGHIEKSGIGYLASKNFETVDGKGEVVSRRSRGGAAGRPDGS